MSSLITAKKPVCHYHTIQVFAFDEEDAKKEAERAHYTFTSAAKRNNWQIKAIPLVTAKQKCIWNVNYYPPHFSIKEAIVEIKEKIKKARS